MKALRFNICLAGQHLEGLGTLLEYLCTPLVVHTVSVVSAPFHRTLCYSHSLSRPLMFFTTPGQYWELNIFTSIFLYMLN